MKETDWPLDKAEQLRVLWAEGMTASEIGRRLYVTKNAVVGKVRRLKLPGRPSPINLTGIRKKRYRTERVFGSKPTLPPMPKRPPIVHVVAIVPEIPRQILPKVQPMPRPSELRCQYTESDGRPWVFCDAPTHWFMRSGELKQSSYCERHHHICWIKPIRQRQMEDAA